MSRLIDADKLIEEIESYRGDIFANEIVELIKQLPSVGEWIPADQPPNKFSEDSYSEDALVKLKWNDGGISYCVGWYNKKYGWSENSDNTEVIAWMPLPWMKLSDLYQPEGGSHE